jgi:hypothetical protein
LTTVQGRHRPYRQSPIRARRRCPYRSRSCTAQLSPSRPIVKRSLRAYPHHEKTRIVLRTRPDTTKETEILVLPRGLRVRLEMSLRRYRWRDVPDHQSPGRRLPPGRGRRQDRGLPVHVLDGCRDLHRRDDRPICCRRRVRVDPPPARPAADRLGTNAPVRGHRDLRSSRCGHLESVSIRFDVVLSKLSFPCSRGIFVFQALTRRQARESQGQPGSSSL